MDDVGPGGPGRSWNRLSSSSSRCPELALFLVIGAGYWIGSFTFGEFSGRDRNVEELLVVLDLLPARSDVGRIRTRSGTSCSRPAARSSWSSWRADVAGGPRY